ncbi:MAG: iron-sulfur cluster repair protein YtfE [Burkholderiaceae bacterium]
MTTLTPDRSEQALGQIAVELPGATAVFRRLKLDFCCGGQIALATACANKGLDLEAVCAELATLDRPDTQDAPAEPSVLIEHILERYHAVHRQQLPELIRMARRVEAVHRDHPDVPAGLADHLETMQDELLDHMEKEEQILFPLMLGGSAPATQYPTQAMRHEHTGHGDLLDKLMAMTGDATPPAGACNTWRALYSGIAQLQNDLIHHIHLENNLLFPHFEPSENNCCA